MTQFMSAVSRREPSLVSPVGGMKLAFAWDFGGIRRLCDNVPRSQSFSCSPGTSTDTSGSTAGSCAARRGDQARSFRGWPKPALLIQPEEVPAG